MVIDHAAFMVFSFGSLLHHRILPLIDKGHAALLFFICGRRLLRPGRTLPIFEQILIFWCVYYLPWGRRCVVVPSGVRSACCQIGVQINSCRISHRINPSSTACIPLVLRWQLIVSQWSPPLPLASYNACHVVLEDSLSARCAPSLCLVLILTERSSLCLTDSDPSTPWQIQ